MTNKKTSSSNNCSSEPQSYEYQGHYYYSDPSNFVPQNSGYRYDDAPCFSQSHIGPAIASDVEKEEETSLDSLVVINSIMYKLKSNGTFDQFRKECLADVDTKPACINLNDRVEKVVNSFLKNIKWTKDIPKVQTRENIRKYVSESRNFNSGIDRIVDQVVNPKINTVFRPLVEKEVNDMLGIGKEEENNCGESIDEDKITVDVVNDEATAMCPDFKLHSEKLPLTGSLLDNVNPKDLKYPSGSTLERECVSVESQIPGKENRHLNQQCDLQETGEVIGNNEEQMIYNAEDDKGEDSYDDEDEEEEESPAFEKIGETPPPSPLTLLTPINVAKSQTSLSDQAKLPEKYPMVVLGSHSTTDTLIHVGNTKAILDERLTESEANSISSSVPSTLMRYCIPDDVDDTPVYFLEPIASLTEKIEFYRKLREANLEWNDDLEIL